MKFRIKNIKQLNCEWFIPEFKRFGFWWNVRKWLLNYDCTTCLLYSDAVWDIEKAKQNLRYIKAKKVVKIIEV
jgi:hypothetical protein